MKNGDNIELAEPAIIERGRGPEIKGTRITVYNIVDYLLAAWSPERIAAMFRISSAEVLAAIDYIEDHRLEVITNYKEILECSARGNPPELQAKLDASHVRFRELVTQIEDAKARGETESQIRERIDQYRSANGRGTAHAGAHGGQ